MDKIKFGVIGLGKIANIFCSDLVKSESATLYGVASRDIEKAKGFAKQYGAEKGFDSYEKLAKDKDVDIIYVATPHNFHKDISLMCMNNGKSVLCEKPAGVNEAELKEMIECAKKNQVFFMEGMWTKFFPIIKKMKKIVEDKTLGEVRHIEANFGYGSWDDENINNDKHRLFSLGLAGGATLDVGIYPITFATWLTDKFPVEISAIAQKTPLGVDGSTVCILKYEDNCSAMLQCSVCQKTSTAGRVYFDKGKMELNLFFKPNDLKITYEDNTEEYIIDDYVDRGFNGFNYEIEHVVDCMNKGLKMSPIHTWDDALELVRIMDKMRSQIDLVYPFEKQ